MAGPPGTAGRVAGLSAPASSSLLLPAVATAVVSAWLMTILAEATGDGTLLHPGTVTEGSALPWLAVPGFLASWQVMVVAMMLPASLPAFRVFESAARPLARTPPAFAGPLARFLGTYLLVWSGFGLFAFLGDVALQRLVEGTPWLAARPWLIVAAVVGIAGAYQFLPPKRKSLEACRHPSAAGRQAGLVPSARGGFSAGLEHAIECLGSSGALMLLMFAAGFANLWWMAALTGLMAYEVRGRHGQLASLVAGIALLALAGGALVLGGLPGWGAT
jgi:predicted metal-binding membrane protein